MKIHAALAADLGILTAALNEPGTDVLHSLHQLGVDAQAAVPSYLGLSVTVDGNDPPFTLTTLEDSAADDVGASVRLTLPGVAEVIFYAGAPGAFVDLAADLAWLTGRPPGDFVLDQHLSVPAGPNPRTSLQAASVIHQAIGALIGHGCTLEQAHAELDTQADAAGTDRYTAAQRILEALTAVDPADAKRADQEPNMG
ncbi:MAG: hypothetical protein PHQ28_17175 [Mycobacterium sp.]|nr:hypothetical protein [Mycobacterium sp.]